MDEQPINEGVAPSDNSSQEETSEDLKSANILTDCINDSSTVIKSDDENDTSCTKLDNNSLDTVHSDVLPNSKHSPELRTESLNLEINNCEEQNKEIMISNNSNIATTNVDGNENGTCEDYKTIVNSSANENSCEEFDENQSKNFAIESMVKIDDASSLHLENKQIDVELNSENKVLPTIEMETENEDDLQNNDNEVNCLERENAETEAIENKDCSEINDKDTSDVNTEDKNDDEISEQNTNEENSAASAANLDDPQPPPRVWP